MTDSATETIAEKASESVLEIIELIDHTPMTYIVAAVVVGAIIGVGIVLLMDDANEKKAMRDDMVDTIAGND